MHTPEVELVGDLIAIAWSAAIVAGGAAIIVRGIRRSR